MSPDAFMPYYGNDFEAACKGFRPETKWAYLCALWHYWHHTHCQGLPDDTDILTRVCEVSAVDWARISGQIFKPPFFQKEGEMWHQPNCRKIWQETNRKYQNRVAGAGKARSAINEPDIIPDIIPDISTDINPAIERNQNQNQNQSQEPEPSIHTQGAASPKFPKLEEVKAWAQFDGVPEAEAINFWNHFEASGWIDRNGHAIVNPRAKLRTWNANKRAEPYEASHRAAEGPKSLSPAQLTIHSKELDRLEQKIARLKESAARNAFGQMTDGAEQEQLKTWTNRRNELRKILNVTA